MTSSQSSRETAINIRTLTAQLSGVQRYTMELYDRLRGDLVPLAPARPAHGMTGHAWEQLVLPWRLGGRLLWSPGGSGPLAVERQVVTVYDAGIFDHPGSFSRAYVKWYQMLLPRLAQRVLGIVTISEFSRDRLSAHLQIPEEKIDVVYCGVSGAAASDSPARDGAALARLGCAEGRYLLAVGTLERRKNLATLVQAWKQAVPRLPSDAFLVIVGAQGASRVFGDSAELPESPRVKMLGHVTEAELRALYRGAHAFVSTALYEGFGLPLVEAASAGVPVIASDIPVFREVMGPAAVFVDPMDPPAIAGAIVEVFEDPTARERLGAAARAAASRYSWEASARQMKAILDRAARG